jgi:hypothetical protein
MEPLVAKADHIPQSRKVLFFIITARVAGSVRLRGEEKRSNGSNICNDHVHPAP